jgi:hypothetical protein
MGMFSGGFLGGGTDESSTSNVTNNTNIVETTTETTMRDVGLTGADAVNLASVLELGNQSVLGQQTQSLNNIAAMSFNAALATNETVRKLSSNQGDMFSDLLKTEKSNVQNITSTTSSILNNLINLVKGVGAQAQQTLDKTINSQDENYQKLLTITSDTTNPALSLGKDLVWFMGIGVLAFFIFKK